MRPSTPEHPVCGLATHLSPTTLMQSRTTPSTPNRHGLVSHAACPFPSITSFRLLLLSTGGSQKGGTLHRYTFVVVGSGVVRCKLNHLDQIAYLHTCTVAPTCNTNQAMGESCRQRWMPSRVWWLQSTNTLVNMVRQAVRPSLCCVVVASRLPLDHTAGAGSACRFSIGLARITRLLLQCTKHMPLRCPCSYCRLPTPFCPTPPHTIHAQNV
jgi:hypothetical protein